MFFQFLISLLLGFTSPVQQNSNTINVYATDDNVHADDDGTGGDGGQVNLPM